MNRTAVENSSLFKSVGYDPATETMELEFTRGAIYQYSGVTAQDWNEFCRAESKGSYFSKNIRGKFAHVREMVIHGVNCPKLPHGNAEIIDYGHAEDFDGQVDVQGVKLCGRCHAMLT